MRKEIPVAQYDFTWRLHMAQHLLFLFNFVHISKQSITISCNANWGYKNHRYMYSYTPIKLAAIGETNQLITNNLLYFKYFFKLIFI